MAARLAGPAAHPAPRELARCRRSCASEDPCVCTCVCACVPVPASAGLPHGSRLEAGACVSQIHFLAAHRWGKGQALFVSPHGSTSPNPDKPNLLKAQNVCAARSGSALTPGPAGARAAVSTAAGQRAVTHRAVSEDLLYCFLLSPPNLWVLRDRYGALGRPCRCWNGLW